MLESVKPWAFEKVINHIGYRNKSRTGCLSCGHKWKGAVKVKRDVCSNCHRPLLIEDTLRLKPKYRQMVYVCVLDVCGRFQVNRFFQFYATQKVGTEPKFWGWEVAQQWLQIDGKDEVVARNRGGMGHYMSDNFHGDMEIRSRQALHSKYNLYVDAVFPKKKILPIYKRNGFKGDFGVSQSFQLFNNIIDNPRAETLLKAKQYELFDYAISYRRGKVERYWNSIKICMRNKFVVKDASMWFDYLELLQQFGKDLNSMKYLRPVNLKKAHDRLVAKRREIQRKQDLEVQKKQLVKDQARYIIEKKRYFGLVFTNGDLTIRVLESVQEFLAESDAHRHCVYTNKYYNQNNSLCFSATIAGVRMETIEVSLVDGKIIQSRGFENKATSHNKRIVAFMKKNIGEVLKRRKIRKKSINKTIAA